MKMKNIARRAGTVFSIAAVSSLVMASSVFAQVPVVGGLNAGWWSAQTLVNVGPSVANVDATAYELSGGTNQQAAVTSLSTLPTGGSITILPKEIAGSGPAVEDIATGSMVISSDQPLVAVVALTNEFVTASLGSAGGTSAGIYEGTGSSNTSTSLKFPVAKQNYFGNTTVFFVQNAGSGAADIVANFSWDGGSKSVTYPAIGENRSVAITPPTEMPRTGSGTLGSATITSVNALAGAVLELEDTTTLSRAHKAGRALTTSDGATNLLVPSFKKNFGSPKFSSAIGIQGDAALAGNIVYTCSGVNGGAAAVCTLGETYTVPFTTSGAGVSYSAWPFNPDHASLPDNSLYSAEVQITSGGNAVVDVGETGALVGTALESQYTGVPTTSAKTNWTCPSHKEKYYDGAGGVVVLPTTYPATVSVEFTVSDTSTSDKSLVGQKYTISNYQITAGSAVFYDVANGISPSGFSWSGTQMPTTPGLLTSAKVTSNQPVVVISNEAIHFSVSRSVDGRQYGCFGTDS